MKYSLLSGLNKVGLGTTAIDAYDDYQDWLPEIEISPADATVSDSNKTKVLFPITEGGHRNNALRSAILCHAFRTRGYNAEILLCDGILPICHAKERANRDIVCDVCHRRGKRICEKFHLDYTEATEHLQDSHSRDSYKNSDSMYKGVNVREFALASTRRFTKKYHFNDDTQIYNEMVRSAKTLVDIAESTLSGSDYDAVIGTHPAYIYGGVFLDYAAAQDINAYSFSGSYREGYILFGRADNRSPMPQFSDMDLVEDYLTKELTEEELSEVDNIMSGRIDGTDVSNYYAPGAENSISAGQNKRVMGLFTNLLWDASLSAQDIVFESPFEWVEKTIDLISHTDTKLIIKTHPAEFHRGTSEGMYEWIKSNVKLPNNVKVLRPDTDIDPYKLISEIDVGVVYNSTIGLEMAYFGLPVITVGDTHYRDLGFTYDPESITEYSDHIRSLSGSLPTEKKNIVKRYIHFLFAKKHIYFPFESSTEYVGGADFQNITHDRIANSDSLDTVVKCIMSDSSVVNISNKISKNE